ncbi:MAG: cytochrome b N-terminal domain-containing protein [Anaerolineales bacterium]|nr:cytochrome b N-terminal domain-containing protein [Anaerolineales bacterium]
MMQNQIPFWKRLFFTTRAKGDDTQRVRAVVNNAVLHLHPALVPAKAIRFSYTWGLGGISAALAVLLGLTGLLLMFRYDASIDRAYLSLQFLETQVIFGSLIRAVHHWSANLLVVTSFLHLLRVFFTGGYKKGRTMNWLIGVGLLVIVLAFNFTGYLLPWDQLAYWAVTVSTSLLGYIPVVGKAISTFLLGGPIVGQGTLRNFYAIHVAVLPVLMVAMTGYHFWKIRKNGGISQPEASPSERIERVTTMPHLVNRELAVLTLLVLVVLVVGMWRPAPLGELANPSHSPNPAKAAWYFLGLQELLLHMDALAAIILVAVIFMVMIFIPYLDRRQNDIGIYFRSKKGRRAAIFNFIVAVDLVPLLVVADEYWFELSNLPLDLPLFIINGLIPLVFCLLGLVLLYGLTRLIFKANHSEAAAGIFTFLMTALIVLTLIGIYFRGPNMALVLPF